MERIYTGTAVKLLDLYGTEPYNDYWTCRRAFNRGVSMFEEGSRWEEACILLGKVRRVMEELHYDLYPEDPDWNYYG